MSAINEQEEFEFRLRAEQEGADAKLTQPVQAGVMSRFVKGALDPIEGGAQLLYNVLPKSVQDAGNAANNWLAEKTGLVAPVPSGGLNEMIKTGEQQYQASRQAAGSTGFDPARLAGNVLSPANLALASKAMGLVPMATKAMGATRAGMLAGGATGASQSALAPVTNGDYWGEKGQQVALGGTVGLVVPLVSKLLPKNTEASKELVKAGVRVPLGQRIGGLSQAWEDKATSVPLLGDAISHSRRLAIDDFNLATLNKTLAPIGGKLPHDIKAGHGAIEKAGQIISDKYDELLPKLHVKIDAEYAKDLSGLKSLASNLPDSQLNQFNRILENEVEKKFTSSGLMSGETMKQVESKLGQMARGYGKSQDYDARQLGDALREAQSILREMVLRNNPQHAKELKNINNAYAMFLRPERAASALGAKEGVFTPAQLLNSVKATDPSLRHRAFARGNAMLQDWAEAGTKTLSSQYHDSGTAGRLMLGGGTLAALANYVHPAVAIPGIAATAAYLPGGRQVGNALLNMSEKSAAQLAKNPVYSALAANALVQNR